MSPIEDSDCAKSLDEPALLPLARLVVNTNLADVPPHVVQQAKLSVLDVLGCIIRGFPTDEAQKAINVEREIGGRKESSVLVGGEKLPALAAARVNGYIGDIWEFNDLIAGHAGIGTVPAALAMAEAQGASGEQFLTAVILGYEVTARIYGCYYVYLKEYTECCCSPVGPPNSFATAAVAAKLLGFDVETTLNAMSISGSLLAMSPMEATMTGSSEKPYMFGGWPASVGIYSALCAKNGMTGTARILEDEMGLLPTWAKNFDLRAVTDGLGEKWILERPRRKIQSCCGYTHSPIDAILSILREDSVLPDDIEKAEITVASYVYPVIGAKTPANYLAAKFCLRYLIAVVMNKMSFVSPEDTSPEQFSKNMGGKVGSLMDKIEVRTEPGFPHRFSSYPAGCCNVKVTTRTGQEYSRFKDHFKGHQEDPLSETEILDKFRQLAVCMFQSQRIEEIINAVYDVEKMAGISKLIDLTTAR